MHLSLAILFVVVVVVASECSASVFVFSVVSVQFFSSEFFLFVALSGHTGREASAHPATTALRTLSDRD